MGKIDIAQSMSAQNTAKGNPTLNLRKRNVMSPKT